METPIQRRIWFIPVMFVAGLLLVAGVIATALVARWCYRRQKAKKYHCTFLTQAHTARAL